MLRWLKNKVKVSQTFWRYRHFVHRRVWQNYLDDNSSRRRLFYVNFMIKHRLNQVFEFGCGSGPNLVCLKKNVGAHIIVYGYDINKNAVSMAKKHIQNPKVITHSLQRDDIASFLAEHSLNRFGLAIYDRVLYLLKPDEVTAHFEKFGGFFDFVIIDDFHSRQAASNGVYHSKNYQTILEKCNFRMLANDSSEHQISDEFFATTARRLVFRNITHQR